ncbi:MAG: bifunctional diaminohydroxyphosphoribosylaminopyrimidine deaminase/5-amino-6-(5-phosphoribosylamino)uracil reductase RibD [Paracoccaceae bacterium]
MADRSSTSISAVAVAAAFRQALDAALAHEGATAPNPAVGCVLLDADGKLLIAAGHEGAGRPHAEALALQLAAERGLLGRCHTAIVTLEPCNHHGRTGPCTEAIIASPIREVWYGADDPNPMAAGGAARLRQAGVAVHHLASLDHPDRPALRTAANRLLAPFASRVTKGRPFITVKQAVDATGSMIPPPGQKTFTGPQALALAHVLRRRADAILTGSGTILADQPEFTVRHVPDIPGKTRLLVILDRRGRVPADYLALARRRGLVPVIATDLAEALSALARAGCNEVLVEAGPSVVAAVRQTGLWDEWVLIEKGAGPDGDDRITITAYPRGEDEGKD